MANNPMGRGLASQATGDCRLNRSEVSAHTHPKEMLENTVTQCWRGRWLGVGAWRAAVNGAAPLEDSPALA